MNFPVRSRVVGPNPWQGYQPGQDNVRLVPSRWAYGLGDESPEDLTASLEQTQKEMTKGIKKAAIAGAAAQTAISVSFMFIPVVGWAIGAIYALVSFFVGKHYAKRTKQVINDAVDTIAAKQKRAEESVRATSDAAYQQELPAGKALALSPQPLEGFFSDFHRKAKKTLKSTHKKIVKVVVKAHTKPIKALVKHGARLIKVTGNEKLAAKVHKIGGKISQAERGAVKYIGDPEQGLDVVTGKKQLLIAKQKAAELVATASKQINAVRDQSIAKINGPEYRAALRTNIARALRGDQSLFAEAARLDQEEAEQRARFAAEINQERQELDALPVVPDAEDEAAAIAPATSDEFLPGTSFSAEASTGARSQTQAEQASIAVEDGALRRDPPPAEPAKGGALAVGGSLAALAAFIFLKK